MSDQDSRVAVVTDSTPYLPPELVKDNDIAQVDLYVGWDGDLKPESSYTNLADFYKRLHDSPTLPTTSQPSVGDFVAVYEPLVSAGRDVVSIHIAAGLSGTCESARSAAETLAGAGHPGRVEVVDAQTGAGGLGSLVIAAADEARRGGDQASVVEAVRKARASLDIWFCLDTLEYLRRGGRIGAAQAMLGSALSIKPILTFGTEIAPVERVRTKKKALARMVGYLEELKQRGADTWIVQYAQSVDDANYLVDQGKTVFGSDPLFCTQVGPVLGAHLGAGVLVGGFERG